MNTEQEQINLKEPTACWVKVLNTLLSVMLLALTFICIRLNDVELAVKLVAITIAAVPTIACCAMALYLWKGKRYLVFQGQALVIHRELLWFKRARCVVPGPNSQLIMRRTTITSPDENGGGAEKLELYMTDAYGHKHLLLQYSPTQKERILAICAEITRQFPGIKLIQE